MQFFNYQKDYHRAWECFSGFADDKKRNEFYRFIFTDEIMGACASGAINVKTFNLDRYTYQCWENEKKDRIKAAQRVKNLVSFTEPEQRTGYGDITENQAHDLSTGYNPKNIKTQEEDILDKLEEEYYLIKFNDTAKDYQLNKGVDLKFLLLESLKGNKKTLELLKGYVTNDSSLAVLVKTMLLDKEYLINKLT